MVKFRLPFRKKPKEQFGKPVFKEEEAKRLTPKERERVIVIPKGTKPFEVIPVGRVPRRGGTGTGRGGGVRLPPLQKAEAKSKQEAIAKQRADTQKVKERIAAEKAQEQKIRAMTVQKRQQFFRKQALISRAQVLQRLQQQGKRLTSKALRTIAEAKRMVARKETITRRRLEPKIISIARPKELRFTQKVIKKNIELLKQLKVSKKIIKDFKEGTTPLEIRIKTLPISQKKKDKLLKLVEIEKELIKGFVKEVKEEPEKIIAVTAASIAAPIILARVGGRIAASRLIAPIIAKIPAPIKAKGGVAVSRFLTGAYLTTTGLQIAATEKGKRAEKTGRILASEVIPFKIGSAIGVRGLLRNEIKKDLRTEVNKLSPNKRAAFQDYMKQAEIFGKFEPKSKNIKLNNIENLPTGEQGKIAQRVIRKFLKDEGIIVGGSVAQTGQINVKRRLGDIDGYKKFKVEGKNTAELNKLAKRLENKLKKAGVKRASSIKGETRIAGKKSIEFHDISRIRRNIEEVTPSWSNWEKYILITPEGIRIQRIGLQAKRKLVAAFADPKRFATGKYKKDLKDFKRIADQLFSRAERNARKSFFFKKKKIKGIERLFKKKAKTFKFKKEITTKKLKVKKKKTKKEIEEERLRNLKKSREAKKEKKKPTKIPTRKKTKAEIRLERLKNLKKARAAKKAKPKKIRPSQKPVKPKKPKKIVPSQPPTKRPKKRPSPPSQPPTKRRKKRPFPPSQPPTKRPKKRLFPPSQPSQPPTGRPSKKPTAPPTKAPVPTMRRKKRRRKKIFLLKLKPKKRKKAPPEKKRAFNVFARPLKKTKKQKRPNLKKINKRPLSKRDARDLRNYIADTSLARTAKTKPTKGIPKKPFLPVPKNYAQKTKKKFRTYRIVKGKKKPLKKGTVIERRTRLLDTPQERRGITLKKRLAQLRKQPIKTIKRKPSLKQLQALKRGRIKLKKLRKK